MAHFRRLFPRGRRNRRHRRNDFRTWRDRRCPSNFDDRFLHRCVHSLAFRGLLLFPTLRHLGSPIGVYPFIIMFMQTLTPRSMVLNREVIAIDSH